MASDGPLIGGRYRLGPKLGKGIGESIRHKVYKDLPARRNRMLELASNLIQLSVFMLISLPYAHR